MIQAEDLIRSLRVNYRNLANLLPGMVFEADVRGNITFVNKRAFEIMGYSPQDFEPGLNVFQFIAPAELPRAKKVFLEVLKEEKANLEFTLLRKDGSPFSAWIHTSPILQNGQPAGLRGIAMDITELKIMAENLREKEKKAQELLQEMKIMAEIGLIITSSLNIEEIYDKFAEKVKELIKFDRIAITIVDHQERVFYVRYVNGPSIAGREINKRIPLAGTATEWIIENKLSLLLNEENRKEILAKFPGLIPHFKAGFRSMILTPLVSRDQVIGLINILAFDSNAYSSNRDLIIAQRVSAQISGAIANALLFEEHKRAEEDLRRTKTQALRLARENAVLAKIGRVISSTLNIEEVYEKFACEVKKLIHFDKVSINIVDFGNATVSLAYVTGKSVPGRDAKDVFPLSGSFTEEVFKKRKGVILHPANEDEVAARFSGLIPVYMSGLKSMMMVPLILRNQPIATMNFMSEAANVYTEAELELAEKIGRQIAGVIANVQFFNTHQQTLKLLEKKEKEARILGKENEIIAKVGKIISSSLNIDDVFEKFALEISQAIPFDKIGINTVDFKTNEVKIHFAVGKHVLGREDKDIFPLSGSFAEEVLKRKKGMFYHPTNQAEVQKIFPVLLPVYQAGLKSIMTVPLIYKDQAFGTLNFMSESPNAYTEDNLRLAERVGDQIAGAVANALLFAEHQRSQKEKEDLQEQLLQAQKMEAIGRLAGGIAHDFNNSLTLMKVSAQLMQMELKDGHPWREKIDIILGAADRSAKLARQLLAFSRRQILEMKVIDLNQLIRELDKMLHRIIGEDIELAYILPEDLRRVKVDPGQIEQVILNLAVNARDAMPKGEKLIVETGNVELDTSYAQQQVGVSPGQYVMLSVSDTGVGMPPEVKARIFEPFFTTKEKGKGTGLGLSMVYGIVKQSGGHIWVYSEPGKGSTFKIYLPAVEDFKGEEERRDFRPTFLRGNETILVVEDEEEVRSLAAYILEKQGYRVLISSGGNEALDLCKNYKEPIHLLLTDVVMPERNGRDLAQAVSLLHPEIKILYMSGYPAELINEYGILEQGINYIQKPFTIDQLTKKIREVLDNVGIG